MVRKLFINNFEESFRSYAPVLILIGVIAILGTISVLQIAAIYNNSLSSSIVFLISLLIIYGCVMAVGILMVIAQIKIVYTNLYKMNAYRLFTFPVKGWQIYTSKVLIVLFWEMVCGVLAFLAISFIIATGILAGGPLEEVFRVFMDGFNALVFQTSLELTIQCLLLIVIQILSTAVTVGMILLAGSLAHSSFIQKNRGLVTFGFYIAILIIYSIIKIPFSSIMLSPLSMLDSVFSGYNVLTIWRLLFTILWQGGIVVLFGYLTTLCWNKKLSITG